MMGETRNIPPLMVGLIFLAVGTKIYLIINFFKAREEFNFRELNLSSSNIFDATVCLPLPWTLFDELIYREPIEIASEGIV
jgi:hypothetical protein